MRCAHCRTEVTPSQAWAETVGFAKPRGKVGGLNALYGRRSTGRVLCPTCGLRLSEGLLTPQSIGSEEITPTQETLL